MERSEREKERRREGAWHEASRDRRKNEETLGETSGRNGRERQRGNEWVGRGYGRAAGLVGASVRLETPARTERWLPPLFGTYVQCAPSITPCPPNESLDYRGSVAQSVVRGVLLRLSITPSLYRCSFLRIYNISVTLVFRFVPRSNEPTSVNLLDRPTIETIVERKEKAEKEKEEEEEEEVEEKEEEEVEEEEEKEEEEEETSIGVSADYTRRIL